MIAESKELIAAHLSHHQPGLMFSSLVDVV